MTVGITELPPEGMQLPGVALAGDPERGTKTTEGISLLFTTAGVTVQGPQPQIERLLVWSALDSATCREKVQLSDGREAAIMELTSGGQSIRFLLPGDTVSPGQAAYLDQALPTWLLRYKGTSAPVAPAAATPVAPGPEVGVTLPPPGPSAPAAAAETAPAPAAETHAPAFAAAAAATGALGSVQHAVAGETPGANAQGGGNSQTTGTAPAGATGLAGGNGTGTGNGGAPQQAAPPTMQAPPLAAPPAPPAAAPRLQSPPPPPPPPAPAVAPPTLHAPPPPAAAPPTAAPTVAPPTGWDDPPLGLAGPDDIAPPAHVKKPRFATSRKKMREAEAASAAGAAAATTGADLVAPATPGTPPPAAPPPATGATGDTPLTEAPSAGADGAPPTAKKKPRFPVSRKQMRAAEAAAAAAATGTAVAATAAPTPPSPAVAPPPPAPATPAPPTGAAAGAPPLAPPADPVPLAVQPPPPVTDRGTAPALHPTPPGGDPTTGGPSGPSGSPDADGVVLADSGAKGRRFVLAALVVVLVLVLVSAGYFLFKKSPSTPTVTAPALGGTSAGATDTVLAGSINLRLTDLPSGWTTTQPAQAVVRPPVAPAESQATAVNAMASCLDSSYAVVSGLFASGSLPGQTSLVQSPVFQSAAGSSLEMASRTSVLTTPSQVQALESVFTNPKFDTCFQQFHQSLAQAATPGSTVAVEPVTLFSPQGVTTYAVVSTYTVPGSGTEVVGDAYLLGGRVVSVIQPTTAGAAIPSDVFAPAYDAVAGRVAAASSK